MSDPRRQLLLDIYAHAVRAPLELWQVVQRRAQGCGLRLTRHALPAIESVERVAVSMTHAIEIEPQGLQLWSGELRADGGSRPAERLGLAAARLLAGHEESVLLAAALADGNGPDRETGALIDEETCARIAVAGLDLEQELSGPDCSAALAAAGDLLQPIPAARSAAIARGPAALYVVIGLRLPRTALGLGGA
ncbi:MAG: MOFRL family protein [Steroidobacterales bacterium]